MSQTETLPDKPKNSKAVPPQSIAQKPTKLHGAGPMSAPRVAPGGLYLPPIRLHFSQVFPEHAEVKIHPVTGAPMPILPRQGGQYSFLRLCLININTGKPAKGPQFVKEDGVILVPNSRAIAFNTYPIAPFERLSSPPPETVVTLNEAGKEIQAAILAWREYVGVDDNGDLKQPYPRSYESDLDFVLCGALAYGNIEVVFDDVVMLDAVWREYGNKSLMLDPLAKGLNARTGDVTSPNDRMTIK